MEAENKELLKKIAYLAVGVMTPEDGNFTAMVDEWVEKGKMTQEEGRKFVNDVMEKAKTIKFDIEQSILEQSKSFYDAIHIATTDQIAALEKRIKALEAKHKE